MRFEHGSQIIWLISSFLKLSSDSVISIFSTPDIAQFTSDRS
ncbi:hypothetical protein [Myxosarcina sp. GI1(2024)]